MRLWMKTFIYLAVYKFPSTLQKVQDVILIIYDASTDNRDTFHQRVSFQLLRKGCAITLCSSSVGASGKKWHRFLVFLLVLDSDVYLLSVCAHACACVRVC